MVGSFKTGTESVLHEDGKKTQQKQPETVSSLDKAPSTVESEEDVYLCRVCDKEYADDMESDMES